MEDKRSRGRPKKESLKKPRTIWMTDQEYEGLVKSAELANLEFSKYAREILLKRKPVFYGDGYKNVFNEVHRHGVNINQAVKSLNEISISHDLSRNPEHYAELLLNNQGELLQKLNLILKS